MTEQPSDWNDVADNFARLGRLLQERFAVTQPAEPRPADGTQEGPDALRSLGDAMTRLGEQISATAQDPEVRIQARRAADSFTSALGSTFGTAADEIGGMMRGYRPARPDEEPWMQASDDDWPGGGSGGRARDGRTDSPEQLAPPSSEEDRPNGSGPPPAG